MRESELVALRLGVAVLDGRTVTRKGLLGRPSSFIEVSIRNERDEDDLVACIVPSPEHPGLTEQEVRAYAEANLPKFMRPRQIRIVDGLPRTPTNKVEKYKLRQRVLAELATAKD
jgi:acyl-CoA synthetase (AMP-forming)/AMP-acid ligase II